MLDSRILESRAPSIHVRNPVRHTFDYLSGKTFPFIPFPLSNGDARINVVIVLASFGAHSELGTGFRLRSSGGQAVATLELLRDLGL